MFHEINKRRERNLHYVRDWNLFHCLQSTQQTDLRRLPRDCICKLNIDKLDAHNEVFIWWHFAKRKTKVSISNPDKYNVQLFIQITKQLILSTYFLYQKIYREGQEFP